MKRLLELEPTDRLGLRAQELLESMGPSSASEARQRRVRQRLDAPARARAPRWVWRAALALCLFGVSAAAAASGAAWFKAAVSAGAPEAARARLGPSKPTAAPAPVVAPSRTTPTAPRTERVDAAPSSVNRAARSVSTPASDVARVHEAAKALRRDADPERALQLLERPGARVSGPLAEEALALRIEASMARANGRQARLAAAYLAQYPSGRYRELALKALAGKKP